MFNVAERRSAATGQADRSATTSHNGTSAATGVSHIGISAVGMRINRDRIKL